MCEIEEVCKTLNNGLWDTQAVVIDGDLRRPTGKEVIVGHKHRKQPRGAKIERPGLDSQERHLVPDGTPRECAKDTREDGEDGANGGDDYTRGEHVCGTLLPFDTSPDEPQLLTMNANVDDAMGDHQPVDVRPLFVRSAVVGQYQGYVSLLERT